MSHTPLFSCVIPVKGDRPFFGDAIDSLKAQGLGDDLEIIVQDADVEPDAGQSDALNKGFAKAKGEWLFWLNADDVLLPGALKKVLDSINKIDRIEWLAGDTVYIDEQGSVLNVRCDAKWRPWFGKKLSVWTGGPSAFFRRELWEKRGGFAADLKYAMDIDLWTRWAKAGERFVGIGEYVWGFRMHEGSKTMGGRFAAEQAKELTAIDAKYGVSTMGFWRTVTRIASVLDGSWSKRQSDTARMRGKLWSEIAQ
jgi:glycosyltransferase involved in cell wall biosynthesis